MPSVRPGAEDKYGEGWSDVYFDDLPYFSVRTPEGNGVCHVVLACEYIPFEWLMEQWVDIAGTCFVYINDPYKVTRRGRRDERDVARYLMSQYVGFKQPDFIYGSSCNWVFKGYVPVFNKYRDEFRDFSRDPYYIGFGHVCYPYDHKGFWCFWDSFMESRLSQDESFKCFMSQVRECSGSKYGFNW